MSYAIYPIPGSFNQFLSRNPEIAKGDAFGAYSIELSMWRATAFGEGFNRAAVRLTPRENALRIATQIAVSQGVSVPVVDEWAPVGGYEVPEELLDKEPSAA